MGGGVAMRTAAKLAGIAGGIKGVTVALPGEQSVRNVSRPVSAVLTSSSSQRTNAAELAPPHTAASWDVEDWEVAEDGELIMEAGEATPRVMFGGVPSFQEARAATTDLKDAIDTIYLKSNSSECGGTSPVGQASVVSPFNTELETTSHAIQAISNSSVPKHAFQAFQLLSASHEAQTAVASIACDPNVWNAVMQNPAVKDFFQSQQQTVAGFEKEDAREKGEELPEFDSGNGVADFMGMLHNLKLTVAKMVSHVSNYLQNIFGFSVAEKSSTDADGIGNTKANLMDHFNVGGTFMGLAMLVVMIVVLKRV